MVDSDIVSHTHRMYLIGENSIYFPWFIPKDFPCKALGPEMKESFFKLVQTQEYVDWTLCQKLTYVLTRVLFPPLANQVHRAVRRQHFEQLRTKFESAFPLDQQKSMRISAASPDYHLAYIDFLDKSKTKPQRPKLPLTLMLSGSGTFNSPYNLNFETDPYAKSLAYFDFEGTKEKLPLFFDNLNTLLGKLSFYKLNRQAMKDFSDVINWVEVGNRTLFNPSYVKASLYLFENSYEEVVGG